MALLIVSTVVLSVPKAPGTKKKAAAAAKAAVTAANDTHKLEALRGDIVRLCTDFKTRIEGDKFLIGRKTEMLKILNAAGNKISHRVVEDLHAAVADFSQKLTGMDYVLTLSSSHASEADDDDDERGVVPTPRPLAVAKKAPPAPVLKSAAPSASTAKKGGAAKSTNMEKVVLAKTAGGDNDDNDLFKVPAVTRKLVVTESGQVARRSARDSKPVADTKLSVGQEQQVSSQCFSLFNHLTLGT